MSGFSAFILTTGNILFRSMTNGNWNGNYLFNSASLSLVGNNLLAHKLRVMGVLKKIFSSKMDKNDIYLGSASKQMLLLQKIYPKKCTLAPNIE